MSEEQTAETTEETTEAPAEETTTEFVEMDPKVEQRFNRIYGNMKQYERQVQQATEDNRKLVDRLEKMEREGSKKAVDAQVNELRQAEKAALEESDFERASNVRDQITELQVESKIPKAEERKEDPPPIDSGLRDRLNSWAAETDAEGNALRPWADSNHEDNTTAMKLVTGILATNPNAPVEDLLDEIDRETKRFIKKPARPAPAVLSADGSVRPKTSKKTTLTSDQKAIAERMYPSMKPDEAAKRYASAMEKYA
jgi:hypothetical protein